MLCLQQIEGRTYNPSLQPEKVVLKPTVTRFGRSEEHSDVVIDSSVSPLMISRVHAEIHFDKGKFRIDCKGLNGLLMNKTKRSSAVLCEGDELVFGGAGVKTIEGQTVFGYDSELVYVFKEVCQNESEEAGSLGEGTSDGRVRRSKRKQPVSTTEELSCPAGKKSKANVKSNKVTEDCDEKVDSHSQEKERSKEDERSRKCLADLNEELLCCICRELMVLAHTLPCSHTFCFGCIRDWLGHAGDCPNCRAKAQLKSAVPVKVLDNTISKVAEEVLSPEELEERQLKIHEMQEEARKKKPKEIIVSSSSSSSDSDHSDTDRSIDSELSDEEEGSDESCSYGVEHARSGRAQCRTCFNLIPYGSLRWIVHFISDYYRHYEQTHYHHLQCFLPPSYIAFGALSVAPDLSRAEIRIVKERLRDR